MAENIRGKHSTNTAAKINPYASQSSGRILSWIYNQLNKINALMEITSCTFSVAAR